MDFLAGQVHVTFKVHLPEGQGLGKSSQAKSLTKTSKKWLCSDFVALIALVSSGTHLVKKS